MLKINGILCPIDFSDTSKHAVDHAIAIARWYGARLIGLHVYDPVALAGTPQWVPAFASDDENLKRLREDVHVLLGPALAAGIATDIRVEQGIPPTVIIACAASVSADLIVIGTHGASGFEHLILGSVTEKILRRATCPVLVVPPRARATSKLPFKRLLCPVDFSDSSIAALRFAFSLAQESDAELTILHVFDWPTNIELFGGAPFAEPDFRDQREAVASARLEQLVPDDVRAWSSPRVRVAHGKPHHEILGVATEDSVDLVVMGVHGRNAFEVMWFGSTTNHVVRQARCPVLTLRA